MQLSFDLYSVYEVGVCVCVCVVLWCCTKRVHYFAAFESNVNLL